MDFFWKVNKSALKLHLSIIVKNMMDQLIVHHVSSVFLVFILWVHLVNKGNSLFRFRIVLFLIQKQTIVFNVYKELSYPLTH